MNPRLIGGEMLLWSDLSPVGGDVLTPLLDLAAGRTLVAGPHDPALLTGDPTLLVRGLPDAEALAERFTVLCGSPAKLAGEWDTIVALDGLERLGSAEEPQLSWGETLDHLLAVLDPAGTLLLGVENYFGLHRLVALPPAPTDADWTPAAGHDDTRPAGLAAARSRLAAAGLTVARTYAVFGSPVEPTALLDTDHLADPSHRGAVEAALSRASATPGEVLTDPRRLAVDAARHGLAAELAPGWIFVAHRGPAPAVPATDRGPAGPTLESLLLKAAAERDLPALRALLSAWQSGPAAGVPAGQVIGDGALVAPGTIEEALHDFAVTLLSGGFPHPFPAPAGAADLTLTLAAMAGTELDPAAIPAAPGRASMQDLIIERDRLARELAEARERIAFGERTIAGRDRELVRARQLNALLSTTKPARALLAGARLARRTVRRIRR